MNKHSSFFMTFILVTAGSPFLGQFIYADVPVIEQRTLTLAQAREVPTLAFAQDVDGQPLADDAVKMLPSSPVRSAPDVAPTTSTPSMWGNPANNNVEHVHESPAIIKAVDVHNHNDDNEGGRGFFFAPQIGSTSVSNSNGSSSRDSSLAYGLETSFLGDHFTAGLVYNHFASGVQGNSSVSVGSEYNWFTAQGRYLILGESLTPFVSGDAGLINQIISTQVLGMSEKASSNAFIYAPGVGLLGRITSYLGFTVGAKYYQFLNVSGFNYSVSLTLFPAFF